MNIKIISVEDKECKEIEILHIYPHDKTQMNSYRRYDNGKVWEHELGCNHGWNRLTDTSLYEEAFETWTQEERKKSRESSKDT